MEKLAAKTGIEIPGDEDSRKNRLAGLGPLIGLAAGVVVGGALGVVGTFGSRPNLVLASLVAGAGAMVGTDAPKTALGVTDLSTWAAKDWLSDAVPHLVYGVVPPQLFCRAWTGTISELGLDPASVDGLDDGRRPGERGGNGRCRRPPVGIASNHPYGCP